MISNILRIAGSIFETAEGVVIVHISVYSEITWFVVVVWGWVGVELPMIPIGMAELSLSCEGTCALSFALREDVPGIFVEIINSIVKHRPWGIYLQWFKPHLLVNDC